MTAGELEADVDRVCEHDEPPGPDEFEDFEPFTAEELAEIREAVADELLAVEAATAGRRGPGQPGSARIFPGESVSSAASFGPGMPLDVLPGCAGLAVAADAAAGEDGGFAGVSEAELVGVLAAWDRSRPTPRPASCPWPRSWPAATPPPRTRSSPPTRSRTRWPSPAAAPTP
jgi:hypothetical protein